jgi:aspartate/glutamate racemase
MTRLLEEALTVVSKLSDSEQDAIASIILAEIADEKNWEESFARLQDKLSAMAEKAREDIQAGRIVKVN